MKILVLNCGSSSLKYQLIDIKNNNVLAKGNYERIGEQVKGYIWWRANKKVTHGCLGRTSDNVLMS